MFKLEQNYRSTQTIVNAAGSIIANNKEQLEKKVWTDNQLGEKIKVMRGVTDNEEGRLIAQSIFEEKMKQQQPNKDFAILYRTNAQSRSLEEALRKHNLPYRIYGGTSFYQRKEVKDMIAYLRLTINHKDEESLKRIINYPTRGIGKTTLDRVQLNAAEQGVSWWDVVANAELFPNLASAKSKLTDFAIKIKSFATMLQSKDAYELSMHIAKSANLLKSLYDDKTVEGISRYENVVELLNGIKEFVEDDTSELEKNLGIYLQDIALITDADKDDGSEDKISLMTIHASKGLEFPNVYISGMEENLFPSQMSTGSRKDLEEERRLFYVGMTRAEKKLTLSYANSRFRFGQLLPGEPSRFITEILEEFIEVDRKAFTKKASSNDESGFSRFANRNKPKPNFQNKYGKSNQAAKSIVRPPVIGDFEPEDTSAIKVDDVVEHQRFGKGKVVLVDGDFGNKKATIEFEQFGKKQLVLKFAKLRFVASPS